MESDESEDEDEDGVKPSTRRALSAAGIEPPKVRTPIAHFKACAMVARIIFQFKDQVPIDEDCAEEEEAQDQDNENQVCPPLDLNLFYFFEEHSRAAQDVWGLISPTPKWRVALTQVYGPPTDI